MIRLDPSLSVPDATSKAVKEARDEICPDDMTMAVLFDEATDRGLEAQAWLQKEGRCQTVVRVDRQEFAARFPFLMDVGYHALPQFPCEVIPHSLYLGSASSVNTEVIVHLGITLVVSLLDHSFKLPEGSHCEHLLINVADSYKASLGSVLTRGLPVIDSSVKSGGKVLVHCHEGKSRSVSLVVACLMSRGEFMSVEDALGFVKARRWCARPNEGFVAQLQAEFRPQRVMT